MRAINTLGAFGVLVLSLWCAYHAVYWLTVSMIRALAVLLGG